MQSTAHPVETHREVQDAMRVNCLLQCFGIVGISVSGGSKFPDAGPLRNIWKRWNVRCKRLGRSREPTLNVMQCDWAFPAIRVNVLAQCESLFKEPVRWTRDRREAFHVVMCSPQKMADMGAADVVERYLVVLARGIPEHDTNCDISQQEVTSVELLGHVRWNLYRDGCMLDAVADQSHTNLLSMYGSNALAAQA